MKNFVYASILVIILLLGAANLLMSGNVGDMPAPVTLQEQKSSHPCLELAILSFEPEFNVSLRNGCPATAIIDRIDLAKEIVLQPVWEASGVIFGGSPPAKLGREDGDTCDAAPSFAMLRRILWNVVHRGETHSCAAVGISPGDTLRMNMPGFRYFRVSGHFPATGKEAAGAFEVEAKTVVFFDIKATYEFNQKLKALKKDTGAEEPKGPE